MLSIPPPPLSPPHPAAAVAPARLQFGGQHFLQEHMDNEFLQRRREIDVPGGMRAASLREYDSSVVVPMWGYRDVEVWYTTLL